MKILVPVGVSLLVVAGVVGYLLFVNNSESNEAEEQEQSEIS